MYVDSHVHLSHRLYDGQFPCLTREQGEWRRLPEETREGLAEALREADAAARAAGDEVAVATAFRNTVIPAMQALREPVDEMETLVDADVWPLPTYGELTYRQ